VIVGNVFKEGPPTLGKAFSASLHEMGPLAAEVSYQDMPALYASNEQAAACQPGRRLMRFPVDIETYNVQATPRVYSLYNQKMQDNPAFKNSLFALACYSVQAFKRYQSRWQLLLFVRIKH
jgi:hypothetical protein